MLKSWHTANTGEWSLVMMSLVHPAAMNIRIPNVSHAHMRAHTHTHIHTRAHARTNAHTHRNAYVRTYVPTHSMHTLYIRTHVHKYTNTHFHCPPPTIALMCLTICKTGDPETRVGLPQHSIAVRGHIDSGLRWVWQTPKGHLVHTTSHVIVYVRRRATVLVLHYYYYTRAHAHAWTHTHTHAYTPCKHTKYTPYYMYSKQHTEGCVCVCGCRHESGGASTYKGA